VVGNTLARAKSKIRRNHCSVGKITRKPSSRRLKGHVIKQSPRAGRRLANGHKVNLTVGRGPRR
jgi:beta-lactam-binding protein with PASTA domain